ncbi:Rhodanese-related sulfurtransferase [Terriglobus roseus DSM 18391]|uniref:Rhodanese-related sulfurtransferase n=1 Tax=Terriglobus roseus (strain DSM 18391 / NRRL B-41598 / KBS 63) TaxID=926566 RepID=I3ZE48_TERRK|nr:rhodanese-like domain-containing protein [Terriglobus roseus]AFL87516.1 Rhodanese-related sulfurtransferase [Terriglobus roseus DSM 18391]
MPLAAEAVSVSDPIHTSTPVDIPSNAALRTPEELAQIALEFAATDGWLHRVQLSNDHRWYERLHHGADYDLWAISWMPGQSTGFHDHGESAGAFVVVTGVLEEHRPGEEPQSISPGQSRTFGSDFAHDVRNVSLGPAVSIHAYSPPLSEMNEYELDGSQLVLRTHPSERSKSLSDAQAEPSAPATAITNASSIDQVLTRARARLRRLSPAEAFESAVAKGALLVDIRPAAQRAVEGNIPGTLVIERNVLEWRLDPSSSARLPVANDHDVQVIVFCSEGYTSSLAAAALQDLGLWRATDVVGGFKAWRSAGLPTTPE